MSLVLEALKKAEAERERERAAVPGLGAHPAPLPPPAAEARRAWLPWALAGGGLAAAALLGWQLASRETPAPPAPLPPPPRAEAPVEPLTAAPTAPAAPLTPAPQPAPAVPPAPALIPAPSPAPAPKPAAEAPPPPVASKRPAPSPRAEPSAAAPARPAEPARPAGGNTSPGPAAEAAIYDGLQALPESVRRALPPLNFGGAMDSDVPSRRMLIVNGQLFHENDVLAPDLVLERIALKSAVFRYRDLRFRVRY